MSGTLTGGRANNVDSHSCLQGESQPAATGWGRGAGTILVCFLILALPQSVLAIGREFNMNGYDLVINGDSRWAGGGYGGYHPIRIRLVNRGPARNITFRFAALVSNGVSLPTVERTIGAEQNATVQFTLSVPLVGQSNHGTLRVYHDGHELESLRQSLSMSETSWRDDYTPAVLAIAGSPVDFSSMEWGASLALGYQAAVAASHGGRRSSGWGRLHSGGSSITLDHEVASPFMLPDKWIDYSGLDLVTVELATLAKIAPEARRALLEWVDCGGTLLVFGLNTRAGESEQLSQLLDLDQRIPYSADWQEADLSKRADALKRSLQQVNGSDPEAAEVLVSNWRVSDQLFVHRKFMLGDVYAFQGNPFPGGYQDWIWFLSQLETRQLHWPIREGVTSRGNNSDFLYFLIPGVKGVPTTAFLVLMTLFTIVIGPVNYIFLLRRKRQYLLLLTIPIFAFLTSLSLFGYSAVAHGFNVKSRTRSLTLLDQRGQTAVTTSHIALYAGLAPSRGLQFTEATALFPIWPAGEGFDSGRVDWTEAQTLTGGWLKSRTRTQFLTKSHRIERGRLEIEAPASGGLRVSNGLEWDIEALIIADARGKLYALGELPAGAAGQSAVATEEKLKEIVKLLERNRPEPPERAKEIDRMNINVLGSGRYRYHNAYDFAQTSQSVMETQLTRFKNLPRNHGVLQPQSYLAVLKENPSVELGVAESEEQAGYHVLVGYY